MKNQEVAGFFKRMADMLEIKGENPFRIRAYQRAAQNIENLTEDIALIAERKGLNELPGIGKDLAQKIANGPALPIRKMKESIGGSLTRGFEATLDMEAAAQVECAKTEDLMEGIKAFIERREPVFKGK